MNPANFLVNNIEENQIHIYCICPNPNTTELIETLEMTRDQIHKYWASRQDEEKADDDPEEELLINGDENTADEEILGTTVNVTGIKHRNVKGESDGEDDDVAEIIDEDDKDGDLEVAKKLDPEFKDYHVWPNPLSSMQVTIVSFQNNPNVRNHIIVCGVPSSISSFIKPLRIKYLAEYQLQKVVIITGQSDGSSGD